MGEARSYVAELRDDAVVRIGLWIGVFQWELHWCSMVVAGARAREGPSATGAKRALRLAIARQHNDKYEAWNRKPRRQRGQLRPFPPALVGLQVAVNLDGP
jgi:hypothetical protein